MSGSPSRTRGRESWRMGELGDAYRARLAALAARLDAPTATTERDALRDALIALGKGLEQDLTDLAALKEEAKALVERWKGLQATAAPAFTAERPIVADPIAASTFGAKGWRR